MKNLSRLVTMITWSFIHYGIYKKIESCYLAGWGFKGKSVAKQGILGLHLCWLPFSKSHGLKYALATCFVIFIAGFNLNAQSAMGVGTTSPNANAVLHLVSPTGNQGFLVPTYSTGQRTATSFVANLSSIDNGLLIFDTDEGAFYFWLDDSWLPVSSASGDMLSSIYDQDENGLVDTATVANSLNGYTIETSVPSSAVFTDSQTATDVVVTSSGDLLATDVQGALDELQTEILSSGIGDMLQSTYDSDLDGFADTANIANALNGYTIETSVPSSAVFTDSQTATDVVVTSSGDLLATDVQGALDELQSEILSSGMGDMLQSTYDSDLDGFADTANVANTLNGYTIESSVPTGAVFTDSQTGSDVVITPSGNLTATDVQAALVELQSDIDAGSSGGDMLQSVYDINSSGVVDAADSLSVDFVDGITLAYSVAAEGFEVRDNAISTAKLANSSVTGAKIGITASEGNALVYSLGSWQAGQVPFTSLSSVPTDLLDGDDVGLTTVNTADIVDGSVTSIKLADGSVGNSKYAVGSITGDKIGVPASEGNALIYTSGEWQAGTSGLTTVATADIVDGAVSSIKLADGSVGNAKYAVGSITGDKIGVPASEGNALIYTSGEWQAGTAGLTTVATADIIDGAVTSIKLANGSVGNSKYAVGSITGDKLGIPASEGSAMIYTAGEWQSGQVPFTSLSSVPSGLADGDDVGLTTVASADIQNGTIANVDLDKSNIPLSGFGAASANVSMGGYLLTTLATPTNSTDAATKGYVDGAVNVIGLQTAYDINPSIVTSSGNTFAVSGDAGISFATNAQDITLNAGAGAALFTVNSSNFTVNGPGDVIGNSFSGDGSGLTNLTLPIEEMVSEGNLFAGTLSGSSLTTGTYNVLYGRASGSNIVLGSGNTMIGWLSGSATTADNNTMIGYRAGVANTSGTDNTFLGANAGRFNTTGTNNIAIGSNAGPSSGNGLYNSSIALGNTAIAIANDAIAIGAGAFADAAGAVAIGVDVNASTANTIILGDGQPGSTFNVGVNTNTPGTELEVNGTVTATVFTGNGSGLTNVTASLINASAVGSTEIADGAIANGDLDKGNIPLSGFGAAVSDIGLGGNAITNLGSPAVATDASTKGYVDTQVSAIVSSQWTNNVGDIYYSTGNVGIGTNTPGEALEVNGTITASSITTSGNLVVDGDINYSSGNEKTYYRTVPAQSFATRRLPTQDQEIVTDNANTPYRYFYGGSPFGYSYADAAIYLPDGAVVDEVVGYLYNNDTVAFTVRGRLSRMDLASGNKSTMATCQTSSVINSVQVVNSAGIVNAQIDNSSYSYFVEFEGRGHSSLTRIYAIRVRYTVTKPD